MGFRLRGGLERLARSTALEARRPGALLSLVVVILLGVESAAIPVVTSGVPLRVTVQFSAANGTGITGSFTISATIASVSAHVALLPGTAGARPNAVFVFYDSGYPVRLASASDVLGLGTRVSYYLSNVRPSIPVSFVDAGILPQVLEANPHAELVIFGYALIPDNVFSANTTLLRSWLDGGGTLVWAGGPIGYFEGHSTSAGFVFQDLGWSGQTDLLGFPLEDAIGNPATNSSGPLLSFAETPLARAIGIGYQGTADGANVSEVEAHGGTDLGYDSAPSSAEAPRTSLAYVPVGKGGLYYFGGALWGTGTGVVPDGDVILSGDIALLAATGYVPEAGTATSVTVVVSPLRATSTSLEISDDTGDALALVTSSVAGSSYLFLWAASRT